MWEATMKNVTLLGIALLLWPVIAKPIRIQSGSCSLPKRTCDFSGFKPLKEPHSLLKAVTKRVEPRYPSVARGAKAEGQVVVRILVNKKGDVVKACVVEGHPLLRGVSLVAAKQWKFAKNFGFVDYNLRQRYAETDLAFQFQLPH
jgi:TonB family protein